MKELFKEGKGLGWVVGAIIAGTILCLIGGVYFVLVLIGVA